MMMSIEPFSAGPYGKKKKYRIVNCERTGEKNTIAIINGFEKAGCLVRFLAGARLRDPEYELAVMAMAEVDTGGGDEHEKD